MVYFVRRMHLFEIFLWKFCYQFSTSVFFFFLVARLLDSKQWINNKTKHSHTHFFKGSTSITCEKQISAVLYELDSRTMLFTSCCHIWVWTWRLCPTENSAWIWSKSHAVSFCSLVYCLLVCFLFCFCQTYTLRIHKLPMNDNLNILKFV